VIADREGGWGHVRGIAIAEAPRPARGDADSLADLGVESRLGDRPAGGEFRRPWAQSRPHREQDPERREGTK